jgi:protoporphyrinogen oxidase
MCTTCGRGSRALPEALAREVEVRLSHPVRNVTDTGAGVEVTCVPDDGSGEQSERFDACVIATTAQPALAMFPQMDANHRALYETARYRRLGSICLGLSRRPPDPATYFLVPPCEDPDTIAVVADHNKSPGRAPDDKGLLTVLLSHEYLERSEDLDDAQVMERAIASAERYHGPLADQVEEHAIVRWPESVPTIDRGRFKLNRRVHAAPRPHRAGAVRLGPRPHPGPQRGTRERSRGGRSGDLGRPGPFPRDGRGAMNTTDRSTGEPDVLIAGGGPSGLAAAYRLQQAGHRGAGARGRRPGREQDERAAARRVPARHGRDLYAVDLRAPARHRA